MCAEGLEALNRNGRITKSAPRSLTRERRNLASPALREAAHYHQRWVEQQDESGRNEEMRDAHMLCEQEALRPSWLSKWKDEFLYQRIERFAQ